MSFRSETFVVVVAVSGTLVARFVPGSPWPSRGLDRLESIAHDAAVRAGDETAVLACGAIRTASLEAQRVRSRERWRTVGDNRLAPVAAARARDAAALLASHGTQTACSARASRSHSLRSAPQFTSS